jgi:hypothetical protein
MVRDRFTSELPDPVGARAHFGLPAEQPVVLLVAGSWGIGDIERTFDEVAEAGDFYPLAVCGNNERLRRRLAAKNTGMVLGWTDEMPALMAAADVLVENAGGLTCMEAFASGLPVVTYRPIAGHGRGNAQDMTRAGVADYVSSPAELGPALDEAVGAGGLVRAHAARAMFSGDAATEVAAEAARAREVVVPLARPVGARPHGVRIQHAVAGAAATLALLYSLVAFGVGTAAAHGVAVARAPHHAVAAYMGIRLNADQLADPQIQDALSHNRVTAIISGRMAATEPDSVARLDAAGVDVANGGWGSGALFRWSRAHADVVRSAHAIQAACKTRVRLFVPARPVDGFDLASARTTKERVVVGNDIDAVTVTGLPALRAGGIFVIDVRRMTSKDLLNFFAGLGPAADAAGHLQIEPLVSLT